MNSQPTFRVRRSLKRLQRLDLQARQSGDRADRYPYLARVLRLAYRFHSRSWHLHVAGVLSEVPPDQGVSVYTLIDWLIRNTERSDRRLLWKHCAALKYAAFRKVEPDRLLSFFSRNHGINGCAELWSSVAAVRQLRRH